MDTKPRIVILGAGYGGIMTAIQLQKQLNYNEADVTLVNKHSYHYVTTHLHMPAAGTDDPENARVDIDKIISDQKIKLVKATVSAIRPELREVELDGGEDKLTYDYLVIGLGGEPETFGIKGLAEHAMSISSINSVNLIKEHIDYMFAKYKKEPERLDYITFIVGGGGFTGIEFVAELADRIPLLCEKFGVDRELVNIYNIEAAPSILPGFDKELVEYAINVLEQKGIILKTATAIKECTAEGVVIGDGEEIKSATVIWTGGIRGNRLVEEAGFEVMRGRVKVNPYLQTNEWNNVYIIGDCSLIFNEDGRPYPPTAQIAMQQGEACGNNLVASIRGDKLQPFTPSLKGTLASLGKGEAIGLVGSMKVKGWTASMLKRINDLRYIFTIGGPILALKKARLKADR